MWGLSMADGGSYPKHLTPGCQIASMLVPLNGRLNTSSTSSEGAEPFPTQHSLQLAIAAPSDDVELVFHLPFSGTSTLNKQHESNMPLDRTSICNKRHQSVTSENEARACARLRAHD